jgi:hypothetical protein
LEWSPYQATLPGPAEATSALRGAFSWQGAMPLHEQKKRELSLPPLLLKLPMLHCPSTKGNSALQAHALPWWFSRSHPLFWSVHPYGVNDGAFAQDQLKLAKHSTLTVARHKGLTTLVQ